MINLVKFFIFCVMLCFVFTSCAHSQECVDGINKLPLFGGVKKCKEQIEDDKQFINTCDKAMSRKESSEHFIKRGWENVYAKKLDTAVMRFNQAWLLDSLNAAVYWGLADVLGMQGKFKASLSLFDRAVKLDPHNVKILQDASTSYGNVFFETKDIKFLDATVNVLKAAARLEPRNPIIYAQLTAAYSYFTQKDSARKYLKITDQIDPNAVNPEVRKILAKK
jgi:tetratricopeptide (TPR) repeat protein